ncbi:hypothetical protein ACR5KS_08860 [Leucobacter sp. W1153]|uniref:hypothetical protein n=1 Tax=Leucobacter sp. W1153 TaxID=3439064 RepID=UPI003F2E8F98
MTDMIDSGDSTTRSSSAERSALPSMIRRSRRTARLTRWGFGATLLACALGLWWIALLAWG